MRSVEIDGSRRSRTGVPEVVFAAGKTDAQVAEAVVCLLVHEESVLITRLDASRYVAVASLLGPGVDTVPHADARCMVVSRQSAQRWSEPHEPVRSGGIIVVTAGTSDSSVAAEALVTLSYLGHEPCLLPDAGVAGIHRIMSKVPLLASARAVIVVAGMDGALPSVVAGLTHAPVVAVPTSCGYGASFDGLTALLAMLNSCSPGIAVVNIDSGFNAAVFVHKLLQVENCFEKSGD